MSQTLIEQVLKLSLFFCIYMNSHNTTVFLVDNGSLRAASTLMLRQLACQLQARIHYKVEAVSLLHSHKVEPASLDGLGATIVRRRLRELIDLGQREIVILPLFLGPSLAIVDYLPKLLAEARELCPDLEVHVAPPLAGVHSGDPDPRLAEILADGVRIQVERHQLRNYQVALVDHGTPAEAVNSVRNAVAQQLSALLDRQVLPCSMERRPGDAYAFNEPLLENLASQPEMMEAHAIVLAMFFLLPGRHAGADGDVAQICEAMGMSSAIHRSELMASHPTLIDILQDRFHNCVPI